MFPPKENLNFYPMKFFLHIDGIRINARSHIYHISSKLESNDTILTLYTYLNVRMVSLLSTLEQSDFRFLHWSFGIFIHSLVIFLSLNPSRVFWKDFLRWSVFLPHTWVSLNHYSLHLISGFQQIKCMRGGINCQTKYFKHFLLITEPSNYFPLLEINQNPFCIEAGSSQNNWNLFILLYVQDH